MTWVTPKTNWNGESTAGVYTGDYFTCTDFNRIKNNLEYLRDLAVQYFPVFVIHSLGADRGYSDYIYADEFNKIEENLNIINNHTFRYDFGETPVFYDNGQFINAAELNRIESAILSIYNLLNDNNRERYRMFVWNFGKGLGL